MKKAFFSMVVMALFLAGLSGCTSFGVAVVNDTTKAGVIVSGGSLEDSESVTIFIDDKKVGTIYQKEIKGYELKNGGHTIYFKWNFRHGNMRSTVKRFIVNNNRYHFELDFDNLYYNGIIDEDEIVPITVRQETKQDDRLLNTAVNDSFNIISRNLPKNAKIAIINIASPDRDDSNFILEELTVLFVNSQQFTIVDRQTLDAIKQERNFQMSGEVSDESVISIGNFIGADVVIIGSISGDGERRRLRLRALDVKTAQVLAMSSEKI
jgi:hypothetical protein